MKTPFTKMNKVELPIPFQTVNELEALIIMGIELDGQINRRKFVLTITEMSKDILPTEVELVFNSSFELFLIISQESILKIEYDYKGLVFCPVFTSTTIENWLDCWMYDIRIIYFLGIVLRSIEKIGFEPDGSKKKDKNNK